MYLILKVQQFVFGIVRKLITYNRTKNEKIFYSQKKMVTLPSYKYFIYNSKSIFL